MAAMLVGLASCATIDSSTDLEAGTEISSDVVPPAGAEPGETTSSTVVATTTATTTAIGGDSAEGTAVSVQDPTSTTGPAESTEVTVTTTETTNTEAPATETSPTPAEEPGSPQTVRIRFESQVADVSAADLQAQALAILNDPRGWVQAGFTFVADDSGPYRVVLAEGPQVDQLCLPLMTYGTVSCQNGPVVALNADRWRSAVDHWTLGVDVYRGYLVNHEVGHLIGQRHPTPRCPVQGRPAGVMEQQTAGLKGCVGNPWPREWELEYARQRPVVYAPLPDWGPDPVPANRES